ncbi:hypothetical protein ACO0OL_000155 [Hanseniaspora opuntiae]
MIPKQISLLRTNQSRVLSRNLPILSLSTPSISTSKHGFHVSAYRFYKTPKTDWVPMKTTKNYLQEMKKDEQEGTAAKVVRFIIWMLLIAMPLVALRLAYWQYQRLQWKTQLITDCEERLELPPIKQDEMLNNLMDGEDLEKLEYMMKNDPEAFEEYVFKFNKNIEDNHIYRILELVGQWDYSRELFVGPNVKDKQKGYKLICPFVLKGGKYDGQRIFVERGWVSEKNVVPYLRKLKNLSCPQGIIKVKGFMKYARPLSHGQFKRYDRDSRNWQVVDLPDMLTEAECCIPLFCQQMSDMYDHEYIATIKDFPTNSEQIKPPTIMKRAFNWVLRKNNSVKESNTNANECSTAGKIIEIKDVADHSFQHDTHQFIEAGVPLGEDAVLNLSNSHFQYMVTWALLAISSGVALFVFVSRQRKKGLVKVQDIKKFKEQRSKKIFG